MIYNYFIHDVSPQEDINNHKNIFDYCIGIKSKGDWIIKDSFLNTYQKINRFYVANKGVRLYKHNIIDGRIISVIADNSIHQQLVNRIDPNIDISYYDINYNYYVKNAINEISKIVPTVFNVEQLNLFDENY
jgi:hypothetical protein